MVLKNNTKSSISLVEAKASGFKQVMLHETINKDGMHRMEHREKIVIPAKGKIVFQHGSYHIMFMGSEKLISLATKYLSHLFLQVDEKRRFLL